MKKQVLKRDSTARKPKGKATSSVTGIATLPQLTAPSGNGDDNGGGNGDHEEPRAKQKPIILTRSQAENAFSTPHQTQAVDYLVLPGDEVHDLAMRSDFPQKYSDGNVKVRAAMRHLAKCIHFHDEEGAMELLNVMAGDVAVGGKRIEMLVKAIIGDREFQAASHGYQKRLQDMAFGKGDKPGGTG